MKTLLPVSKAAADMFLVQCIGTYPGHMAELAHSPTIKALVSAHGVNDWAWQGEGIGQFADFLRAVADQLKPLADEQEVHP